ncbi:GNAT family N-acetyltransferase [Tropicibacter oceani]|uniref:GNAT family N-acetyltransferase n=1 Tax=Tropicibacter oceani TaxID=3058420 RepID=A0ABY8QES2_9RHOB|nr:GNAT family N-acetyltransferase [Tropicibacter oceani]WGW02536.1 GNAT family N-acetyltransferase [Tropicibacter oceani]
MLPLPQSPEFARTCDALGLPIRRMQRESGGELSLVWQVQSRNFGPLGRVDMISRGPVARDPACLPDWLDRFQRWQDGRPLLLNSDGLPPEALRQAGFWPLMTPASLALLPLGPGAALRAGLQQKWRNRLNRAMGAGLRVTRHALSSGHWLLTAEAAQARKKGYRSLPPGFALAFARANPGKAQLWEVNQKGQPLAAVLMLRHGRMATWQMGHVTPEGRKHSAMNLALFTAMTALADQGHSLLDLGTINTQDAPGLARFKLGTGAQTHRLGGSWLHYGALAPIARRLPMRLAA